MAFEITPTPTTGQSDATGATSAMKISDLQATHHRLDLARVRLLKAMYRGGKHLLSHPDLMSIVFPKYTYENVAVYKERCSRAFYENVFAMVVNMVSAGLAQDPAHFDDEPGDEFWQDFLDEATAPSTDGSTTRSFDQVMRDVAVEGLVTGWSWLQVELPKPPTGDAAPTSFKEQEDSGALDPYLVPWPTSHVLDWSEDDDGSLIWLKTYHHKHVRPTPASPPDVKLHVWTVWTVDGWERYQWEERKDHPLPDPTSNEIVAMIDSGPHSFERVPWLRFDVSHEGGTSLWIGDVIESLCRNYFNRQNGEAYQWTQYNYQQLYEFLGPEVPGVDDLVSDAQTDPNRAKRRRAPGEVHVRGAGDKAEFIGPNMAGADVGRNALQDLRDGILRITSQMALAQDTSGAMLRRSADSKRQDSVAQEIVLGAIGKRLVVMMNKVLELVAIGRGDAGALDDDGDLPRLVGYERFNVMDSEAIINQASLLELIKIPSATFQIEQKYQLALTHLGDNLDPETRKKIRDELESAITQDQIEAANAPPPSPFGPDPMVSQPSFGVTGDRDEVTPPGVKNAKGASDAPGTDASGVAGAANAATKKPFGGKPSGFPPKKPGGNPFAKKGS